MASGDKFKISIDSINGGISVYDGSAAEDQYSDAVGIDIDENDRIYVVDQQNFALHIFQYMNKKYLEENPVKLPTAPTASTAR